MTDGLFDPAVGGVLSAMGYDRSFAPGALDSARPSRPPRAARFLDVVLEERTRTVVRPCHVLIDLGGMAKGHTVDRAALHLAEAGAIDAGGDAALRGFAPSGGAWLVEIEDPQEPSRTIATLAVSNAAVATSAPNRRWWRLGASIAHHLIDPRTGTPSTSDLLQATVTAPSAELADVLAKTAFLLGAREGRRFLEGRPGVGGVLVCASGEPVFAGVLDVREVAGA
jgi:thiamine biosynthesis lipoprotein